MKTLDELDRLHAAAIPGTWHSGTHGENATVYVTSVPPMRAVVTFAEVSNDDNARAIVAMHNAWPEVSARLRAAEAVLRLLVACDDMINDGGEPPVSRAALADMARAALGGHVTAPDPRPYAAPGDLVTAADVLAWLRARDEAHEGAETLVDALDALAARLDRERRQACRRGALAEWQTFSCAARSRHNAWTCDVCADIIALALAFRAAARQP
jgi:hypothetical protein